MSDPQGAPEPETAALLQAIEARGLPPLHTLRPDEARRAFAERVQVTNLAPVDVESVEDVFIPDRAGGELRLRVYRAAPSAHRPLLLYFHGGGFVIGSVDTHDPICRYLAARSGWTVVSVDYRLAPEHRYPAAVHDALDAFDWVCAHTVELGANGVRVAVAGDSAGGTLAAVTAQHAKRRGQHLAHQILLYPALDQGGDYSSRAAFRDKFLLTMEAIQWFARHYFGHAEVELSSDASPARASDFEALAPAYIVTAELDPFRDEAAHYAALLEAAGVRAQYRCAKGTLHGFLGMARFVSAARAELEHLSAFLRSDLATDTADPVCIRRGHAEPPMAPASTGCP